VTSADDQKFTFTHVPNDDNNDGQMSPILITLENAPATLTSQKQGEPLSTWDDLVRHEIILGDTGAPAALDPDDVQDPPRVEIQEQVKGKTWSELVSIGAVLGDDGTNELDMDKKVMLWCLMSSA
jgi:hypothetical protein